MYYKKLVGENIYLSPVSIENVKDYTRWLNDFDVTDYIGKSSKIYTEENEKEFLENCSKKDNITLGIIKLENDKLIGNCGLNNINEINRTAILGIFIGEKKEQNKGLGAETIKLLLDYGFNYLNLHGISLEVYEFNKRAIKCYEKVGFRECGRKRESKYLNGKYYDIIIMDILKSEFKGNYIKNKNV